MTKVGQTDERLQRMLRSVAPGTSLREGLEQILRARTGGLLVVGDSPEVMRLAEGGFRPNAEYTPAAVYELAKMDGALVLSHDLKRIACANVQLVPDPSIPSQETGIRHRTAERVAKQTGALVISISQRRNVITLYRGPIRYVLRDPSVVLTKANQAIQTLERYRAVLDQALTNITALEFEDLVTLLDVTLVVQRTQLVLRIVAEIERYISELGNEGHLVSMQLQELAGNVQDDGYDICRDYHHQEDKAGEALEHIAAWSADALLDPASIARELGYGQGVSLVDTSVSPRGYRLLRKIPRLPHQIVDNLVQTFGGLQAMMSASIDQLDAVEGIGESRARSIKEGLRRLRDQALIDRHL